MRPANLKTKIFLDGGNPNETKEILDLLGFLDGQTTNPTLISKNPEVAKRLETEKFTQEELLKLYKEVVSVISPLIPNGSVSIQVYSDKDTKSKTMVEQGKKMYTWVPNAHIKYPTTREGLKAASESVKLGMKINMTLVFSQQQAAAVYSATIGAKKGQVILSPFIGRLDDRGENGMSLIENIIKMFERGDGHVEILAASIRNLDHLLYSFQLNTDIVTLPPKIIKEWFDQGMSTAKGDLVYPKNNLLDIPFQQLDLSKPWQEFNINHQLTDQGIEKFASDWNSLI
ncbi:transaldolase [Candidatus Roizmanbacteria bacterium]|nr:transaldolase [Candidatus Roizmanbacteria bacterium]